MYRYPALSAMINRPDRCPAGPVDYQVVSIKISGWRGPARLVVEPGDRVRGSLRSGYIRYMRLLRGLAGVLLWVVALLLAIVALLLCLTVLLIPLGLPLLGYARRLFTFSVRLMFPGTTARASQAKQASAGLFRRGNRT